MPNYKMEIDKEIEGNLCAKVKIIGGYYNAKLYEYFILEMGLFDI